MQELIKAFIKFQQEVPKITKNKINPYFSKGGTISKYADLSQVVDICMPTLNKNGLCITQTMSADTVLDSLSLRNILTTRLYHSSSEMIESSIVIPSIDDPQKLTAAITYLRRTQYISILGLVADDEEDGNDPSNNYPKQSNQSERPQYQTSNSQIAKPISEGQRKAIYAISQKKGLANPELKDFDSASKWIKTNG